MTEVKSLIDRQTALACLYYSIRPSHTTTENDELIAHYHVDVSDEG